MILLNCTQRFRSPQPLVRKLFHSCLYPRKTALPAIGFSAAYFMRDVHYDVHASIIGYEVLINRLSEVVITTDRNEVISGYLSTHIRGWNH